MRKAVLCLLLASFTSSVLVFGQGAEGSKSRRYITLSRPEGASHLPYSDAVRDGDTLYIAGRIGLDPNTGNAPADVDTELRYLFDEFGAVLQRADMDWDDLVSVQVFCTDLNLYSKFNDTYRAKFRLDFPARAFIGAGSLLRGGHFEMMGIARKHTVIRKGKK